MTKPPPQSRLYDVVCNLVWDESLMTNPDGRKPRQGALTTDPTVLEVWAESHSHAIQTARLARSYRVGFDGYALVPIGCYVSRPEARWNPGAHSVPDADLMNDSARGNK